MLLGIITNFNLFAAGCKKQRQLPTTKSKAKTKAETKAKSQSQASNRCQLYSKRNFYLTNWPRLSPHLQVSMSFSQAGEEQTNASKAKSLADSVPWILLICKVINCGFMNESFATAKVLSNSY